MVYIVLDIIKKNNQDQEELELLNKSIIRFEENFEINYYVWRKFKFTFKGTRTELTLASHGFGLGGLIWVWL